LQVQPLKLILFFFDLNNTPGAVIRTRAQSDARRGIRTKNNIRLTQIDL
jgi:hypothetical protein